MSITNIKVRDKVVIKTWNEMLETGKFLDGGIRFENSSYFNHDMDEQCSRSNRIILLQEPLDAGSWVSKGYAFRWDYAADRWAISYDMIKRKAYKNDA